MNYDRVTAILEERNVPANMRQWLEEFYLGFKHKGPTAILCGLTQLGIDIDGVCSCVSEGEADSWLHQNHRLYNTLVYRLVQSVPGLIAKLRKALQRDLRGPDTAIGDGPDNIFGSIALKSFGRLLLQNFITPQPTADWVDLELV